MTDINTFSFTGRIANNTEYSQTKNGTSTLSFSIAVNRDRKVNEQWIQEASFFYLTVYGNRADGLRNVLQKGMKIGAEGHLRQDTWTDQTGKKQYKTVFCVENIALLGPAKNPQASDQATSQVPEQAFPQNQKYPTESELSSPELDNAFYNPLENEIY